MCFGLPGTAIERWDYKILFKFSERRFFMYFGCKTTLETGGKDVKLHSKRVKNMRNYTLNEWGTFETTQLVFETVFFQLVYEQVNPNDAFGKVMCQNMSSRSSPLLGLQAYPTLKSQRDRFFNLSHSFRVGFLIFSTRFECILHLLHSFRVYFSHLLHSFRVCFQIS